MRWGPCTRCGKSIDWEDQFCSRCEDEMNREENEKELLAELAESAKSEELEGWNGTTE